MSDLLLQLIMKYATKEQLIALIAPYKHKILADMDAAAAASTDTKIDDLGMRLVHALLEA